MGSNLTRELETANLLFLSNIIVWKFTEGCAKDANLHQERFVTSWAVRGQTTFWLNLYCELSVYSVCLCVRASESAVKAGILVGMKEPGWLSSNVVTGRLYEAT